MVTLFVLLVFALYFTLGRGERVTNYFLFLHHFGRPHCKIMYICKYKKISRMSVCISVVLWYIVWIMKVE
jgi:hypothetical protein